MSNTPYRGLGRDDLIVRDHLALNRTVLANERTLLAYVRTTLTMLIGGASFIQFFDSPAVRLLGWLFASAAAAVLAVGFIRYWQTRRSLYVLLLIGRGPGSADAGRAGDSDR